MSRYTDTVFTEMYLVLGYINFACLLLFQSCFWSEICISWICNYTAYFWHVQKLRNIHVWGLQSSIPTIWYLLALLCDLWIVQAWSVNYAPYFEHVQTYRQFMIRYLALSYMTTLTAPHSYFSTIFCWLV